MAVSYSVSESAGMMEHRARDNSHTPYESAGMIELGAHDESIYSVNKLAGMSESG